MNNQEKRVKEKIPTSKIILVAIMSYIILLTPIIIGLAFEGYIEPIVRLIEGTFALATIAVGFYYWKAKAENLHKYKQDDNITMNGD